MSVDVIDVKGRKGVPCDNTVTRISRFWERGPLVLDFIEFDMPGS